MKDTMSNGERLHRPEPERTAPRRSAATYLRDPPGGDAPARDGEPPDDDPVARGVRVGYEVLESQLREGQRLAQRLGRAGSQAAASASGDLASLLDRVRQLYEDVGALCFDALGTILRNPAWRDGLAAATRSDEPARGQPDSPGASSAGICVEIASPRRTRIALALPGGTAGAVPRVHALHSHQATDPPLTCVRFDADAGATGPCLRIEVPEGQPAGTYTGVVVDAASNEPRGTLTVRLLD